MGGQTNTYMTFKYLQRIYGCGDKWRHKIIYEKTDESYEERYASLLKAKGDNFKEDSRTIVESLHADIRKQTNPDTEKEFLKWRRGGSKTSKTVRTRDRCRG